jgi:predicted ATPase/DNA-binding XRE family transcriptional regulator/Tfp pilus assembly protein PilF
MALDAFQTFGELLTYLRKRARLTQAELGRAVGYSREQIVRLEKNQRVPDRAVIAAVFIPALNLDDVPDLAQRLLDLVSGPRPVRTNLPAPLTSLIGREIDVAAVRDYLLAPDKRLITLIGPPGIGKTRLSLQVAGEVRSQFADGVFFVPLAPIVDLALVAPTVVHTLGFPERSAVRPEDRLISGIGQRQMLIVLDNFEQVVDAAPLCVELLSACANLKIIVTSRESLRVPGEWLYPVPSLTVPAEAQLKTVTPQTVDQFSALRLFAERARAVRPDFALTPDNTPAVAAICRQLDGLPLAIELIASRIRLMSPSALLTYLTSDFTLHADGLRGVPPRQKTLHNAIAWSYDRLSGEEQALLAHLAVFAGGFTLEAAQAITLLPNLITHVTSLVDKSLLVRSITAHAEVRFSQLEMIHDFARDRLRERNEEAALRDRHLAYFLDLAERADREMRGPDQIEWGRRIESEYDNLHAALEWSVTTCQTEAALRLLGALGWPWEVSGHYREARRWLDRIRALPDVDRYPDRYAHLLNHIARYSLMQDRAAEARTLLEESQAIARRLGTEGELILADTLNWLGLTILFKDADAHAAKTLFERSLELHEKWSDVRGATLSTFHLGIAELDLNHHAAARARLESSLSRFRELGDLFFTSRVSIYLGHLNLSQQDYRQARQFFEQQLRIDTELQFWDGMAEGWRNLGYVYRQEGNHQQASQCFENCVQICLDHGLDKYEAFYTAGLLALYGDDYERAAQRFAHQLHLARRPDRQGNVGALLLGVAAVAAGMNQPERAAQLSGAAQTHGAATAHPLSEIDRVEMERHIHIAREQLGEAAFEALAAEGRTFTLEQAIDLALQGMN